MKKKIAIIGAGISGLIFANLLKQNSKYDFAIYEKNSSLNLNEGYGIQLSVNSISIINKIGFKNFKNENKFNPKRIDFYSLKSNNKICDLNISQFNYEDIFYTTLKRSSFIEFFKEKLLTNSIQFNKKIKKINQTNFKIEINFNDDSSEIFDYLVISDGVFSPTKSILFNENIRPKYFGSLAIRTLIKRENFTILNPNNISIFFGPNTHLVIYPINPKNDSNLITIIKRKLNNEILNDNVFFKDNNNIKKFLNESPININGDVKKIFDNVKDLKCFPIFVSDKIRQYNFKNIFFLGDALFATPPTFAQGASQSIESAYELFKTLNNSADADFIRYYKNRIKRTKMINRRSKLNYLVFHVSNPIFVFIRNKILKILVSNKNFLNKYLGQIYLNF